MGERRAWYKLARRQCLTLQECQDANTSSEFVEWLVFLQEEEWEETTTTHYYLAQIAAEIRAIREGFSESPKGVSIQDCILKFTTETAEAVADKPVPADSWSTMRGLARDVTQPPVESLPMSSRTAQAPAGLTARQVEPPQHVLDALPDWKPPNVKWVETGPELVKNDPKWAQVNLDAKQHWAQFLGAELRKEGEGE